MKLKHLFTALVLFLCTVSVGAQRKTDPLDRGLVGVPSGSGIYLSWRVQADEYYGVKYNLYRGGSLIAQNLETSNYLDVSGNSSSTYTVAPVRNGVVGSQCAAVSPWSKQYLEIPMADVQSSKGTTVWTQAVGALIDEGDYQINDVSLGDVDGDGKVDFIVKRLNQWDRGQLFPTDNSQYFAHIECYASSINYGRLWWIDCGRNICYGSDEQWDAVAFDWNEDGACEVLYRGGAGTVLHHSDGTTETIGSASENIRGGISHIANMTFSNSGEEWLIYIDGRTGKTYDAIEYPLPRGAASDWGDGYGHRSSKYFMGAPYLDGNKPYIFLGRGIYTKTDACTYKVNSSNKLEKVGNTWHSYTNKGWYGQGYHNFSIADVDEDGADEIVYGSMVLDFHTSDNSLHGMASTGLGHGDASHTGDLDPFRKGLETFACNEDDPCFNYRNAATCEIYARTTGTNDDGRSMAGNFTNDYPGGIGASTTTGIVPLSMRQANPYAPTYIDGMVNDWNAQTPYPMALNFRIYWDGDLLSETVNGPGSNESYLFVDKLGRRIFDTGHGNYETACINSTKKNPCASGDILGDWREELIMRSSDNKTLRVYTTNTQTNYRMQSLWYDHEYRQAMVWQSEGYNQPPHPSFFVGEMEGLTQAPPAFTKAGRTIVGNGGSITTGNNGQDILIYPGGEGTEYSVTLAANAQPSTIFLHSRTTIEGGDQVAYRETKHTFDRIRMSGTITGATNICKQGDAAAHLAYADHTTTGKTDVWAGALICNGTLRNSDIWANRFTELYLGNNLTDAASLYKSITMEYGSALFITNQGVATPYTTSTETGHLSVGDLYIKEGSRVVFDIKGNNNADGDKIDITGNLTIRKQTSAAWVNYGPEHLAPIFQFRASKPIASGRYLLGTFAGAVPSNLDDIEIECTTEDAAASKILKVDGGSLYLVVGGNSSQAGTGTYYLMNVASGSYISLGSSYGSHLTVDGQGKVITISGTENDYLLHVDGIASNKYVDANGWSDRQSGGDGYTTFTLDPTTADGYDFVYKLKANATGKYLKWRNDNITFKEVWSADFSEVPSGMTYSVSSGSTDISDGTLHYNQGGGSGNRAINTAFTDDKFKVENEWMMEFDMGFQSANTNPSTVTFATNSGNVFTCTWASYATSVAVTDALGNSVVDELPCDTYPKGGAYSISKISHVTLHGIPGEGVYLTIIQNGNAYVNYAKVTSTFGYPKSLNGSLGKALSYMMLDNISFKTAQADPNIRYQNEVIPAENGNSDEYKWVLVSPSARTNTSGASASSPADMTYKIANPDMEADVYNGTGDTWGKALTNWTGDFVDNYSAQTSFTGHFAEKWVAAPSGLPNYNATQNLTGLPNGTYRLSVDAKALLQSLPAAEQGNTTGTYVFAGDQKTEIHDIDNYSVYAYVSGGNLSIGVKTESTTANWVSFDNVRLSYYGDITIAELLCPEEAAEYIAAAAMADAFASKLAGDAQTSFLATIDALKVNINSNDFTAQALLDAAEALRNSMKDMDVDMTSAILNAQVTGTANWTNGTTATGQQYSGAPDDTYLDITWNANLDIHQDNVNLPAGKYMLKCATRGSASTNGYVYVKSGDNILGREDVHKDGSTGGELGNGWSWTYIPFEVAEDGYVTVGFSATHTGQHWAGADDFSLTYYGEDFPMCDVTVHAVDASGNIIRTIKSGEIGIGSYVSFPYAIEEQGVWYTINEPVQYSEQILESRTITRTYTINEQMIAFVEGESGVNAGTNRNASGGAIGYVAGQIYTNRGILINDLSSGRYQFVAAINNNAFRGVYLRDAGSTDHTTNSIVTFESNGRQSQDFILSESKTLVVNGKNSTTEGRSNQSADFDYAYILRLGDNYMDIYAERMNKMRESLDEAGRTALGNDNPLNINSTEADFNAAIAALETSYLQIAKGDYLNRLITEVTSVYPVGEKMFDYAASADATSAFNTAVEATCAVRDNASATSDDVIAQVKAMRLANEAYAAELKYNGPAENVRYSIKIGDMPMNCMDGGSCPTFSKEANVNYVQAFVLEEDANLKGSYRLAYYNAAGTKLYLADNGDDSHGISSASDASAALVLTVERSDDYGTSDVIYLRNSKLDDSYLCNAGGEDMALGLSTDGKASFTITEAAKATPQYKVGKVAEWGTFIAPFAVDVPDGSKAYTVVSIDGSELVLNDVGETIPANTPVVLQNVADADVVANLAGYGTASQDEYQEGLLVGSYTNANLPITNEGVKYYILQRQGDETAFFNINKERAATPYRCYLAVPKVDAAASRLRFPSVMDDPTAIENVNLDELPVIKEVYNVSGVRIAKMQRGVNIIRLDDGTLRKVYVK